MIEYGRSIRWYNDYVDEVNFSKANEFDLMQIWYMKGKLLLDKVSPPIEEKILAVNYPIIIHAVYDLEDYEIYTDDLIRILKYLHQVEVIIHPVCSSLIDENTIYQLRDKIYEVNLLFKKNNIKLYIENNSRLDKINYTIEDLKIVFDYNVDVELLLDIAHIDSYEHLEKIIEVKYPKCLHLADKRFSVEHEHLALGHGELDFELIFSKYLENYTGKIILEVVGSDEDIIKSKQIIKSIIKK